MSHAANSALERSEPTAPIGVGLHALVLPAFLEAVPDELWCPTWWEMDGEPARVYALNLEKSEAANRVLMDDAY